MMQILDDGSDEKRICNQYSEVRLYLYASLSLPEGEKVYGITEHSTSRYLTFYDKIQTKLSFI